MHTRRGVKIQLVHLRVINKTISRCYLPAEIAQNHVAYLRRVFIRVDITSKPFCIRSSVHSEIIVKLAYNCVLRLRVPFQFQKVNTPISFNKTYD